MLANVGCICKGGQRKAPSIKRGLAERSEVWGSFKFFSPAAFGSSPSMKRETLPARQDVIFIRWRVEKVGMIWYNTLLMKSNQEGTL